MQLLNWLKPCFQYRHLVTIQWNLQSTKCVLDVGLIGSKAFILICT